MQTELRDYQQGADRGIRRVFSSDGPNRIMTQMPTGAGKTKLAAHLALNSMAKGHRVAFTVPFISLINQTAESFQAEGLEPIRDIGVIQADHEWANGHAPLQVCSLATLARRDIDLGAKLVLVDEAHIHNKFLYKWMEREPDTVFIGLSATPWSRGLGKYWDQLVIGTTTQDLINQKYLSDFRVFAPSSPDLDGLKVVRGDWEQKELGRRVTEPKLIASIVDTWLERAEGRPTILYAVNRAHAKQSQEQFLAAGVSAGYVDAHTDRDERERVRTAFHAGDLSVVCNVGVLVAGVDWDVRCVVLACPTRSEIKFVQMVGRGLRTAKGKDYCMVLDHSDTHQRLGFVTDIHHSRLDTGKEVEKSERQAPEPKPCPKCKFLMPPKTRTCEVCGFERVAQSGVGVKQGELIELKPKKKKGKTFSREEKEQAWAELLWVAEEKGHKQGWVYHTAEKWKGVPKNRPSSPRKASKETLNYIKYLQIAWAKSRKKQKLSEASATAAG